MPPDSDPIDGDPELQFDWFDPRVHYSVPPSRMKSAWELHAKPELSKHALFEVARAFPQGIPGFTAPVIEALDDEQILAMAKAMSVGEGYKANGPYTSFEVHEVEDLVKFCEKRESTVLPRLLRQYFSGLEYQRYQRLLLATDDRRVEEEHEEDPARAVTALIRRRVDHEVSLNQVGIADGTVKRGKIEDRMVCNLERRDRRISRLGHEFMDLVRQLPNLEMAPDMVAKMEAWRLKQEDAAEQTVLEPVEANPVAAFAPEPVTPVVGLFKRLLATVFNR